MRSSRTVVVTDGMWRKSLSAIRSLGHAGFSVCVMGDTYATVGFWSKYTSERILSPTAEHDPEGFVRSLMRILRRYQADVRPVIVPMEDASVRAVIAAEEHLRPLAHFLIPPQVSFEIAADKGRTADLARHLGIPHPESVVVRTATELVEQSRRLPQCVVKPLGGSGSRGVRYHQFDSLGEADAYLRQYGSAVVQERIPAAGDALGVSMLFDDRRELVAHFCHKRLRQYPVSGGPSTDRISVSCGDLLRQSEKLVSALDWRGVAMVEWKLMPDGTPSLIEINPRFWGSLALATRAGVDFPVAYVRASAGERIPDMASTAGVRCRWMAPGEVLRYLNTPKDQREPLPSFLRGLPHEAEEWDSTDFRGTLSTVICQGLAVAHSRYRSKLRR